MFHCYARVSGSEQARDGNISLPEQLRRGRAIAMLHGGNKFDVVEWVEPGVSGTIPLTHRPAGKLMWEQIVNGDTVIASKLDRLFRSSSDALTMMERFRERKISVILIDMGAQPLEESATAKLFFTMLAAFAAFERESITQRCKDGIAGKKARGGAINGTPPFGYKKVGTGRTSMFVPDEKEQEIVQFILRRLARGMSHPEVLRHLNRCGYVNRAGTPINLYSIGRIQIYEAEKRKREKMSGGGMPYPIPLVSAAPSPTDG